MEKNRENSFIFYLVFYYFPWVSTLILIFVLSHQPGRELPHFHNPLIDKLAHLVEYFVLSICSLRVLNLWANNLLASKSPQRVLIYTALLLFIGFYGLADELHQRQIEGRVSDMVDLMMDILSAFLLIALYELGINKIVKFDLL
ncbi:MAG: VanZ family protein [Candidatus Sumerlaeia bacterium]|nr:VanZ family protein [Candidatus Sumerlaeia bacterium]